MLRSGLVSALDLQVSVDEFLAGMARYDEGMREMWAAARDEGRVLRYTASLTAAGEAIEPPQIDISEKVKMRQELKALGYIQ